MRSQDLIVQGTIFQQGIQSPQQFDTRGQPQYLQKPLIQQVQTPQYQNYTPQQTNQPQSNQYQGFVGANYVPMNMQTSVSRQTYQPSNQGQQYQPTQQYQQNPQFQQYQNAQQYQPNQAVRGQLPTGNQAQGQNQVKSI